MKIAHPTDSPKHPVRIKGTPERRKYLESRVAQDIRWVNGNATHNSITGECVLDFSCCHPHLGENTTQDERIDYLRATIERRDDEADA